MLASSKRALRREMKKQNAIARRKLHEELRGWSDRKLRAELRELQTLSPNNPMVQLVGFAEIVNGGPLPPWQLRGLLMQAFICEEKVIVPEPPSRT